MMSLRGCICLVTFLVVIAPSMAAPAGTGAAPILPHVEGSGYTARSRYVGRLTLKDALDIGLAQNLKIAMAAEDAAMTAADTRAAGAGRGLRVSASVFAAIQDFGMIYTTAPDVMPTFYSRQPDRSAVDGNLMAMVPLFTGGRLEALLKSARASEKAALARVASQLVEVGHDVRVAYARVLEAREALMVASWEVDEQTEGVRVAEQRFAAGRVAKFVVLRARTELARARQAANDGRARVTTDVAALKAAMGVDMASSFEFADTLVLPPAAGDEARQMAAALAHRPDVLAARHGVSAALLSVTAAQARWGPQAYAVGMLEGQQPFSRGRLDGGYSIGAVLSIPIVDGGERRAGIERAQAQERRNRLALQALELEATRQITEARAKLEAALSNVSLAEEEVDQATEDLRVAKLRVDAGRAIQLELLDAVAALARARYGRARAVAAAQVADADLIQATGEIGDGRQ